MRLGKEQAAGYVEDTGTDSTAGEEIATSQPEETELTPEPQPAVAAG
jgi:hypothetical protein